jgi:antitoxin HigA-1
MDGTSGGRASNAWRAENCASWRSPIDSLIFECRRETAWKHCEGIAQGSTASGSTISIEFVSLGLRQEPRTLKSSITTDTQMDRLPPVTPGELLKEEFLIPMGISQYRLAKEIGVPAQRIGEIIAGRRSITADTDLRLCRFFSLSNGYWLRAQVAHDTEVAKESLQDALLAIRPWAGAPT